MGVVFISLISKSIEVDTRKLIENIGSNPDMEQELVGQFVSETNRKIGRQHRNMFIALFTHLYSFDYESLLKDTTKFIVLGAVPRISRTERAKLLRVMLACFRGYMGNDYSVLLDECADKCRCHKVLQETGDDLPFV